MIIKIISFKLLIILKLLNNLICQVYYLLIQSRLLEIHSIKVIDLRATCTIINLN